MESASLSVLQNMSLKELDDHLKHNSYLQGHLPSKADIIVLDVILKTKESLKSYCHLFRWYCHMATFNAEDRKLFPETIQYGVTIQSSVRDEKVRIV